MELTKKEIAFLKLYKRVDAVDAYCVLHPDTDRIWAQFRSLDYSYSIINSLINFIFTKDYNLIENIDFWRIDDMFDMVFTLSDIACRYGLENPNIPKLYRMENKKNLNNYNGDGGMTLSFKSTSSYASETSVFKQPDSIPLSIDTDGFVPYIAIDRILESSILSDEKEILFPPCISAYLTGKEEEMNKTNFFNVLLADNFDDIHCDDYKTTYERIKKDFISEAEKCKKEKIVSDDLNTYCSFFRTICMGEFKKYVSQIFDDL